MPWEGEPDDPSAGRARKVGLVPATGRNSPRHPRRRRTARISMALTGILAALRSRRPRDPMGFGPHGPTPPEGPAPPHAAGADHRRPCCSWR